jgi:hypothetical protein
VAEIVQTGHAIFKQDKLFSSRTSYFPAGQAIFKQDKQLSPTSLP